MSITIPQNLPLTAQRGWSGEEFNRLTKIGFFAPDEKLELIEGNIVPKMTQNPPHAVCVSLTQKLLSPRTRSLCRRRTRP